MSLSIPDDLNGALSTTRGELIEMAARTLKNLEQAVRGLMERDENLCREVVADDMDVDDALSRLDRIGTEVLARFKPVATDQAFVIASMKIAENLERISKHSVNVAKRARSIAKRPELAEVRTVQPLYEEADRILRDAISAFLDGNGDLARSLGERDENLDRLQEQMFADFSTRLRDSDGRSEEYAHLIQIVRSLGRVGDLAVDIAEDSVLPESAGESEGPVSGSPVQEEGREAEGSSDLAAQVPD